MLVTEGDRKRLGSKAFDLYRCRLLGTPVPDFYVVPTEFHAMTDRDEAIEELREELTQVLEDLGGVVAVRSSSVVEDTYERSQAGQYRTVLEVDTVDALVKAVVDVWSSSDERGFGRYSRITSASADSERACSSRPALRKASADSSRCFSCRLRMVCSSASSNGLPASIWPFFNAAPSILKAPRRGLSRFLMASFTSCWILSDWLMAYPSFCRP